jgi:DNA-binding response OmpR family regulator
MLDLRMGSLARSPVTVLVVEDDDDMRELLVDTLERDGYFVLAARSASEASTYLRTGASDRKIDLVLADVRMAGPSGIDFGHQLRGTKSRTSTPLILMTAFPEPSVHLAASTMNAVVLPKPFRLDVLRREVLTRIAAHLKELEDERDVS